MIHRLFDALTLSFTSIREIDLSVAINNIIEILKIEDIFDNFSCVGRDKYYSYVLRYNDISILVCREDKLAKQGICIRFSGNGLAFYQQHLSRRGETLKRVLRAWRCSSINGDFTSVTRIDYAIDEKTYCSDTPLLTLRKIRNCCKRHEVRSLFRKNRGVSSDFMNISFDTSSSCGSPNGDTIYFGSRRSPTFLRIYDKLLEQKSQNIPIEDGLTNWVRCEFEFKDSRAMAVVNAFCDYSDDDFNCHMSDLVSHYVSFVTLSDNNLSRCPVKRWWNKFLELSRSCPFYIPSRNPSSFRGVSLWVKNISPTLYQYIKCTGLSYFLSVVSDGKNRLLARHQQLENDFLDQFIHNTSLTDSDSFGKSCNSLGLEKWAMTSSLPKKQLVQNLQDDYVRFRSVHGLPWKKFDNSDNMNIQYKYRDSATFDEDFASYAYI